MERALVEWVDGGAAGEEAEAGVGWDVGRGWDVGVAIV